MLTEVHSEQYIGQFQVAGPGVTVTNGDNVFTVYATTPNQTGFPNTISVSKTTYDAATNTYSTTVTDRLAENQTHDGVPIGAIEGVSQGEELTTFNIGGATKIISASGNVIRIFELDTVSGDLTLESVETISLGDTINSSLVVSVAEDQSEFTLSGSVSNGSSSSIASVRYDADGTRIGQMSNTPTVAERQGSSTNAEVDDGAGGIKNFVITDHPRSNVFTVAEVVNGVPQSTNTQAVGSAGSGAGDRFAISATSVRVPQSGGGPDRTFVYFTKQNLISAYEVNSSGTLTFQNDTTVANSSNSQQTTFFTDGGGEVFALSGSGSVYSVNDNGSLSLQADLTGQFTPLGAGDYDLTVLDGSLHVVLVGRSSSTLKFIDTNIPATTPIIGPFPCFALGAMIDTDEGARPVETLKVGDWVRTEDHGFQQIRWIGHTHVSRALLGSNPNLVPIRIAAGALGPNVPSSDLVVSPQHRMLISSKIVERMTGEAEALVPAVKLLGVEGVERLDDLSSVEYFHILLSGHEVIFANGAKTESLLIGSYLKNALSSTYVREIMTLFPEAFDVGCAQKTARTIVRKTALVRNITERHEKNGKPLVSTAGFNFAGGLSAESRLEEAQH